MVKQRHGKKSENTVAFHIYYIDGDSILPSNGITVTINTDKDQAHSVKADGTVSSLKCEESDAEISFVTDDAPFYVLGTKTPESSLDTSPESTGKKDDSLQNSSQTAVQNVNKDGDKSPNTGLGAGAALTMLLLGAVVVSVSKKQRINDLIFIRLAVCVGVIKQKRLARNCASSFM